VDAGHGDGREAIAQADIIEYVPKKMQSRFRIEFVYYSRLIRFVNIGLFGNGEFWVNDFFHSGVSK